MVLFSTNKLFENCILDTTLESMVSQTSKQNKIEDVYLKLAVDNDTLNILEGRRLDQLQQIFHSVLVAKD